MIAAFDVKVVFLENTEDVAEKAAAAVNICVAAPHDLVPRR
jgi:hypothetical protein